MSAAEPLEPSPMPSQVPALAAVTAVRVLGRYVLELTFDTGEVRVLDLEPMMWSAVYVPLLADYDLFCQVRVDPQAGTIGWPNGAEWAPDELYAHSKAASPGADEGM